MKAISPVLPLRRSLVPSAPPPQDALSLAVARSKSLWDEEPLGLLCDMNDCYSRLKELVPSLPQDRSVSKMEILQHVIDYILDLQLALDSSSGSPQHHRPEPEAGSRAQSAASAEPRTSAPQQLSSILRETDELMTISR